MKGNKAFLTSRYKAAKRKLSPRFGCTKHRAIKKSSGKLIGGPLDGLTVSLSDFSSTLPISMNGQEGRYVGCVWEPTVKGEINERT